MKQILLNAALVLALTSVGAFAAPLNLNFMFNGTPSGAAGSTVTLNGTATNLSGSTLFLNADSFTLSPSIASLNDNLFFSNWPLSLPNNGTFTGNIFTVVIASNATPGLKLGTFNILGGPTAGDSAVIGTAQFQVTVVTPEPASGISMALGLGAMAIFAMRARAKRQSV